MKVIILAGGFGTRMGNETLDKPKPMVTIGGYPILWHIMKEYYSFGYDDFVICAGYRGDIIKEYFYNYQYLMTDFSIDNRGENSILTFHDNSLEKWRVTIVDTGLNTMTGGRIKRIRQYVGNEPFMMTYGDGVCDVDISLLQRFHESHGKIATLTSVYRTEDKGVLSIGRDNTVKQFREKDQNLRSPINAGYMVLDPKVFDYISGDECVFEKDVLEKLAVNGELKSFEHNGFWHCMDSVRDKNTLELLWENNLAAWKRW